MRRRGRKLASLAALAVLASCVSPRGEIPTPVPPPTTAALAGLRAGPAVRDLRLTVADAEGFSRVKSLRVSRRTSRRSPSVIPTWRPSLEISRSGTGVASSSAVARAAVTSPTKRVRPRHSASHSPPARNRAKVSPLICGISLTAPGCPAVKCAMPSSSSSDFPASHHTGAPAPAKSSNSASATSGMVRNVTSGIASTLASAP